MPSAAASPSIHENMPTPKQINVYFTTQKNFVFCLKDDLLGIDFIKLSNLLIHVGTGNHILDNRSILVEVIDYRGNIDCQSKEIF